MKASCSRRSSSSASRPAFTLVELLMVIVVIGMLAALLLPAIAAAMSIDLPDDPRCPIGPGRFGWVVPVGDGWEFAMYDCDY